MTEEKKDKIKIRIKSEEDTRESLPEPSEDSPEVREESATGEAEGDPRDLEILELKERIRRLYADFENSRRRLNEDYSRKKQLAEVDLLREFLEVMDNLERAIESSDKGAGIVSLRQGLELVYRQMRDILEKRGVKVMEAEGKPFDPNFHEAVLREVSDKDEGIVLEEVRKGYCLDDNVIRPCMVKVSYKE